MEQPDVRLERVTKKFGEVVAVDDLSLSFDRGGFVALLGPSGCGKTTTLRMIGGFEEPTAGTVYLGEQDVTGLPPYRREVNTVFQNYALFPHMSIFDNVAFGLRQSGSPSRGGAPRPRDARPGGADRLREAQADPALRRPGAAGRAGPGADQPAAGAAAGRAAGRPRPEAAQADAARAEAHPDEVNITFIHVTHDQEEAHDHGRPDRGDEPGPDRADRPARRALRAARTRPSWPASWASAT